MKLKIMDIKKRNWFVCLFTWKHWKVKLKLEKKIIVLNCWANINEPELGCLWYSIEKQLDIRTKDIKISVELLSSTLPIMLLKGKAIEVIKGKHRLDI